MAITPDADLLVPVAGLDVLRGLQPDMGRLARLGGEMHLRGFCAVSRETVEPMSAVHSRFFAPHFGIPEDVVTGSVHSPMAVWLHAAGVVPGTDGRATFTAEQGDGLGRPGRLSLEVDVSGGSVTRVPVGGAAVTVLRGVIRVP